MEERSITPADVTAIKTASPEDIVSMSETVIEATNLTNKANEELKHLSNCLADFAETNDKYQKNVSHVRNQMRCLAKNL